ncbi:hypothetical protein [Parabacteroides sp.]|uniref:hypothetical protein n=1 Tax=Parabacteroides sp. TaxID=1869337 RepID=UPI00257EB3AD|nr:hypothetical protein [Parabacteroides sp.]
MRIVAFLSIAALSSLSAWVTGSEAVPDSISGPKIVLESNTLDLGVMKANEEKEDTVFSEMRGTNL